MALLTTMVEMMMMAVQSCCPTSAMSTSITKETSISRVSTPTKGLMKALMKVETGLRFFSCATSLRP